PKNARIAMAISKHSPVHLSVTDPDGNTISDATGIATEEEYIRSVGDLTYATIGIDSAGYPEDVVYSPVLKPGAYRISVSPMASSTPGQTYSLDFTAGSTTISLAHNVPLGHIPTGGYGVVVGADQSVTVDTTPPEIMLTFSTSTNALAFSGIDDMGTATMHSTTTYPTPEKSPRSRHDDARQKGTATTTVTARDAAGNTTALIYTEKLPSPAQRDTITIQSVSYNGATTTLSGAEISYKWRIGKNGQYKLFASYIRTAATGTESHYRPKKNKTIIMTKPIELDDTEDDEDADKKPIKQILPGMVIPSITTHAGSILVDY
ncbi:MAG: hypothetical protein AAB490_02280, partial [Patescibacteria group bacterium]